MKIILASFGKQHESYVREGVQEFTGRLSRYYPAEWMILPPPKMTGTDTAAYKKKEAEIFHSRYTPGDYLVCLDERGKNISSPELATFITDRANQSIKRLIFLIGGAYGIDETVMQLAKFKWSLSNLVLPHQLVRLVLAEQLYRACTIINNEKYHHG
jgi:23S rRNA (pseudouridine1915-N3)-methyltransferase